MVDKLTLKLDDVTIQRTEDGTITIAPRSGGRFLSMALLIACGITALLCGGGLVLNGVMQLFDPEGENPIGFIVFGILVSGMFGSMANYLFQHRQTSLKQKPINISPITNTITIGQRVIAFVEVEAVTALKSLTDVVEMEGVQVARFTLALKHGESIHLGNLAVERAEMDERQDEIVNLLNNALKKT